MTKTSKTPVTAAPPAAKSRSSRPCRSVFFHHGGQAADADGHDKLSKMSIAKSIAALMDMEFAGELDPSDLPAKGTAFLVPSDTLVGLEAARQLGVHASDDLFGGVVPHGFIATKLITHELVRIDAPAPEAWSPRFGECIKSVVLPGYAVFTADDLLIAGERMLKHGPVRLKDPDGVGGAGQWVINDESELSTRVASVEPGRLAKSGLVLERQLNEVTTHSVGQVSLGPWTASYCGTQRLTRNHQGHEVYGGSRLTVVRGGYELLQGLPLDADARSAVEQALVYHGAAMSCFPGLIATRSNYDIASGVDDSGRRLAGVLEQSWRIGGASGAEIAALLAFRADPQLQVVIASTHEAYSDDVAIPQGAHIHFDGVDPRAGRLTKYAVTEPYGHA